jgi:hypothetical protein
MCLSERSPMLRFPQEREPATQISPLMTLIALILRKISVISGLPLHRQSHFARARA